MITSNLNASVIFLFIFVGVSCGSPSQKSSETSAPIDSSAISTPKPVDMADKPTIGLLKGVEDAGYPMATLAIEFPDQKEIEYFNVNMEAVPNASMPILSSYIGKKVKMDFKIETVNTLLDIYGGGKSIFGEEFAPEGDYIKTIEGTLSGAEEETAGDLPDMVAITDDKGQKLDFEFFITPEMVAVNKKRVKGYYDFLTRNTVTSISKISN